MKTRTQKILGEAYQQQTPAFGDGPLSCRAPALLARYEADENRRVTAARQRQALQGKEPALAALRRIAREAEQEALLGNDAPAVLRFELYRDLRAAAEDDAADRGLRTASLLVKQAWTDDPHGSFRVSELEKLKEHCLRDHPRSKVGDVINASVTRSGFGGLPLRDLIQIASKITDQTTYEAAMRAHGLDGTSARQIRARAFVRAILEQPEAVADPQPTELGGDAAALRALSRWAQLEVQPETELPPEHEEPPVARPTAEPLLPLPAADGEEEVETETETVTSPYTGEEMIIELQPAPSEEAGLDIGPSDIDQLQILGQLDEMGPPEPSPDLELGTDLGLDEPEETVVMSDPTAPDDPGAKLEVTVQPATEQPIQEGMPPGPAAPLGLGSEARVYDVHAVHGGIVALRRMARFEAATMLGALRQLAASLQRAGGKADHEVRARPDTFAEAALIVLDKQAGDCLFIAKKDRDEKKRPGRADFEPSISGPPKAKVPVGSDGAKTLTAGSQPGRRAWRRVSAKRAASILRRTAAEVEDDMLRDEEVVEGPWRLAMVDGELIIESTAHRSIVRRASLWDADSVIDEFMRRAASERTRQRRAASRGRNRSWFEVRPFLHIRCGQCREVGEYIMPRRPAGVRCSACGHVSSADDVGRVATAAELQDYGGHYVLLARLPDDIAPAIQRLGARKVALAVRDIIGPERFRQWSLDKQGTVAIEVQAVQTRDLNRIERVLGTRFGLGEVTAAAPAEAETIPPVNPLSGTPTQHAGGEMTPPIPPGTPAAEAPGGGVDETGAESPMEPQLAARRYRHAQHVAPELPIDEARPELGIEDVGPSSDVRPTTRGVLDDDVVEAVAAALVHYRNQQLGPLEALGSLSSQYKALLENYGPKTSQRRHMAEAEIIGLAGEVYSEPAVLSAEAGRRRRRCAVDLFEPQVNQQQPSQVPRGTGDKELGPDSDHDDSITNSVGPPKVNQSVPPKGNLSDTSAEPDTEGRDPGSYGAPKPPTGGSYGSPPGKGQRFPSTDLGRDSDTGDNTTTRKWDSVAGG